MELTEREEERLSGWAYLAVLLGEWLPLGQVVSAIFLIAALIRFRESAQIMHHVRRGFAFWGVFVLSIWLHARVEAATELSAGVWPIAATLAYGGLMFSVGMRSYRAYTGQG